MTGSGSEIGCGPHTLPSPPSPLGGARHLGRPCSPHLIAYGGSICGLTHHRADGDEGIRHGGLRRYFERNDVRRLHPAHVARIGRILAALDGTDALAALSAPSYRLHRLKGDRLGQWSVRVSNNWRIVFRVEDGQVFDMDLTDYH